MESINTLKNAATKAIWGDADAHQEPVSGMSGDVSKGEPYDAGNMDPSEVSTKSTAPDETGTVPVETETAQPKESPRETHATSVPETNPAEAKDSSKLPGDSTKGQNDVRSPSDPETHHENAAPKENVDDSASGMDVGDNPDKLDGPGPKPLEVIARENGGDAGQSGSNSSLDKGKSNEKAGGSMHLPDNGDEHEDGTGELYVKSSGLKADGGDFDAAAPGAGREADRLLDVKGVHKEGANGGLVQTDSKEDANGHANGHADGRASPTKEKTSLRSKIKAKLHRNSASAAVPT